MRVLVLESTSEWRWVEVNEWRRVALIHSISFTGRLYPSVQGTDDLRRLSGLFRYHVRTHWNGVHQNRRESKGQCQDCLFGGCDLYFKWWVQRVRRIVFIRDTRLKKLFFLPCVVFPRPLRAHVVLHLRPPDHNRVFRPAVCGTEVRARSMYSAHAVWKQENLMMNFLQIWAGRRPLHRLGRSYPLHRQGQHPVLLHHELLQSEVRVPVSTPVWLCVCLFSHRALICALSL